MAKQFKEGLPFQSDDLAKQFNIKVLRTPPYHCEFNPIELVWKDMKHYLETHNTEFKPDHISNLISEFQKQYQDSIKNNHIHHVTNVEKEYSDFSTFEDETSPLIIQINDPD